MKGSEPEWANEEQITSQVISPTNVGHILWQVYLEMFCVGYTWVHILKVKYKCCTFGVEAVPRNVWHIFCYLDTHSAKATYWTCPVAGVPRNAT